MTWKDALDAWRLRRRSPYTAHSQFKSLRIFFRHAGVGDLGDLTREHLEHYVLAQSKRSQAVYPGKKLALSSLNKYLQALKVFLFDCHKRGWLPLLSRDDISEALEYWPAKQVRPHELVSDDDMRKLLTAAYNDSVRAFLVILRYAGLRCNEAVMVKARDLHKNERGISIYIEDGKNHKSRSVPLSPDVYNVILRYAGALAPDARLFPLSNESARYHVHRAAQKAGLAQRITPHGLRHTYAYELVKAGVPIPAVSKLLGHSNISTTWRYVDHFELEQMQQFAPHLPEL